MKNTRYALDGRAWITVARAAKLLGTNAQGVRKLMADGSLDWRQTRVNSRILVVPEEAVMELRKQRPPVKLKRSPDPLERRRKPSAPVRSGFGMFGDHHLRMTLLVKDEAVNKTEKADPGSGPGRRRRGKPTP